MSSLAIHAFGVPRAQGSSRAFVRGGRAVVTSADPNLRPWRDTVTWAARDAMEREAFEMLSGGVSVKMRFWLPRIKSAPRTRDIRPVRGLDLDKMVRSVNDSLTNAGVFRDDSQVIAIVAEKYYCVGPDLPKIYLADKHQSAPGVQILVRSED